MTTHATAATTAMTLSEFLAEARALRLEIDGKSTRLFELCCSFEANDREWRLTGAPSYADFLEDNKIVSGSSYLRYQETRALVGPSQTKMAGAEAAIKAAGLPSKMAIQEFMTAAASSATQNGVEPGTKELKKAFERVREKHEMQPLATKAAKVAAKTTKTQREQIGVLKAKTKLVTATFRDQLKAKDDEIAKLKAANAALRLENDRLRAELDELRAPMTSRSATTTIRRSPKNSK